MTNRKRKIDKALVEAKKFFRGECVISKTLLPDGAHILPRSVFPELANCKYNVVPLRRSLHYEFDKIKDYQKKVDWLFTHADPDHVYSLRVWIDCLNEERKCIYKI